MATPTPTHVERAVFELISEESTLPGGRVPYGPGHIKLQERGFTADQINETLQSMQDRGWIVVAGTFIRTTDAGFAEMQACLSS